MSVGYHHVKCLRPHDLPTARVGLNGRKDAVADGKTDCRHTGLIDPYAAELLYIGVGVGREGRDEVVPGGVAVGVVGEILPDTLFEVLLSGDFGEFAHHQGRLIVDDVVVDQAGIFQVVELLADGSGALRTVLVESGGHVDSEPLEVVVKLREQPAGEHGGKVVGKHLFGPHIVKPLHGHIVAKPHVGSLMGYQLGAAQMVGPGGILSEEDGAVIIECGTGVLHASKLESGENHEVIFGKGVGDAGIFFEYAQGVLHLAEYFVDLRQPVGILLAIVSSDGASVARVLPVVEFTGRESEEIGAQRFGWPETDGARICLPVFHRRDHRRIAHGLPCGRHGESEIVARLHVGLVEAGEHGVGSVGHEESVHVARIAVEGAPGRGEIYAYGVLPLCEKVGADHYVSVAPHRVGYLAAVDAHTAHGLSGKVHLQRLSVGTVGE